MKRAPAFAVMVILLATMSSCRAIGGPAISPTPTSKPSLDVPYIDLGFDVPYETIPPVNPGEAKELQISIPKDMKSPRVIAMPRGGALALGQKTTGNGENDAEPSRLMAARYDAKGNVLWTREYGDLPDGYPDLLQPLDEDGFVFTFFAQGDNNNNIKFIVFCGADGHVYYHESSSQSMLYQNIVSGGLGAIVLGDAVYKDGKPADGAAQGSGEEMLSIMTQSEISSVFFSRTIGVKDYYGPGSAVLSKDTGMVVSAYKRVAEGVTETQIVAFNIDTFQQKWNFTREKQDNQYFGGLYTIPGGVLAYGFNGGKPFILKLGADGRKLWEIAPDGDGEYSVIAMAALPDGRFAAAINRYKDEDSQKGLYLALYDADGKMLKRVKLPNEIITDIVPTENGEFITVGIQNIKTLPQPAYVSSIWYDTETIATAYDGGMNMLWRKVYDRYKDTTQRDIVVPAADGNVIVEK